MGDRITGIIYWLSLHTWAPLVGMFLSRTNVVGKENVPKDGGFILTSNHLNNADPPAITGVIPRRIYWMAKTELFKIPFVGLGFRLFGYIPVRRFEADLGALRKAQETLAKGRVLGMFPEGTRSKTGVLGEGEPGTAVIALRTGAPIVPMALWGTDNFNLPRDLFKRTRVEVRIGEPFRLERSRRLTKHEVADGTREIMKRIAALLPEERRGAYGTPQAEPTGVAKE
jgi:1-acyl-sn-glycerol-3-phosphate acyltransferase